MFGSSSAQIGFCRWPSFRSQSVRSRIGLLELEPMLLFYLTLCNSQTDTVVVIQAVTAVNTFNGTDLAGRKIMVREDREDRDVKQYNR